MNRSNRSNRSRTNEYDPSRDYTGDGGTFGRMCLYLGGLLLIIGLGGLLLGCGGLRVPFTGPNRPMVMAMGDAADDFHSFEGLVLSYCEDVAAAGGADSEAAIEALDRLGTIEPGTIVSRGIAAELRAASDAARAALSTPTGTEAGCKLRLSPVGGVAERMLFVPKIDAQLYGRAKALQPTNRVTVRADPVERPGQPTEWSVIDFKARKE